MTKVSITSRVLLKKVIENKMQTSKTVHMVFKVMFVMLGPLLLLVKILQIKIRVLLETTSENNTRASVVLKNTLLSFINFTIL